MDVAQSSQSSLSAWRRFWTLAVHKRYSEDTDQTGHACMPRLIWVFARCTGHFVGFWVLWFIYHLSYELHSKNSLYLLKYHRLPIKLSPMKGDAWFLCLNLTDTNWAMLWQNLLLPYVNNKGANQPVHLRSLMSAFIVRCLDSIIPLVSISEISSLCLASLAAQSGLCLTWSQTPKTGFLVTRLNCFPFSFV